ncbi:MAG: hypothetical protein NZ455_10225 [Bacteroidia bacterium]|nr:hypothetical protein [Bacteroidia bacterium]
MRRASRQAWCEAPRPRFYPLNQGVGRSTVRPAARRPCPHKRSETWARTRPKKPKIYSVPLTCSA